MDLELSCGNLFHRSIIHYEKVSSLLSSVNVLPFTSIRCFIFLRMWNGVIGNNQFHNLYHIPHVCLSSLFPNLCFIISMFFVLQTFLPSIAKPLICSVSNVTITQMRILFFHIFYNPLNCNVEFVTVMTSLINIAEVIINGFIHCPELLSQYAAIIINKLPCIYSYVIGELLFPLFN